MNEIEEKKRKKRMIETSVNKLIKEHTRSLLFFLEFETILKAPSLGPFDNLKYPTPGFSLTVTTLLDILCTKSTGDSNKRNLMPSETNGTIVKAFSKKSANKIKIKQSLFLHYFTPKLPSSDVPSK